MNQLGRVGGGGGVTAAPVPLKVTLDTVPAALLLLWVTLTVAVFAPVLVGANRTVIVHDAAGAIATLQPVGVAVNIAALVPVTAMLVTVSGALPLLLTVTLCVAERVPVLTDPNASDPGAAPSAGASPVPSTLTVVTVPATLRLLWVM